MLFPDEHFFTYLLDTWIFSFAKHVLKFSSNSLLSNIFLIDLNGCFIYSRQEPFFGNIYSKYFLLSSIHLMLYFFLNYLFIYLFMAVLGLRFCARAFSSCGEWGPLFIVVHGPLTIAASLVAEHRLQTRRLSSCGSRA